MVLDIVSDSLPSEAVTLRVSDTDPRAPSAVTIIHAPPPFAAVVLFDSATIPAGREKETSTSTDIDADAPATVPSERDIWKLLSREKVIEPVCS